MGCGGLGEIRDDGKYCSIALSSGSQTGTFLELILQRADCFVRVP